MFRTDELLEQKGLESYVRTKYLMPDILGTNMTNFAKLMSFLTVLGGVTWIPVPFLQAMSGRYPFVDFAAIVAPLLLISGVYGLSKNMGLRVQVA